MASASGTPVPAIARLVVADEDTVRNVIHAFNERGLAALDPQWREVAPRLICDDDITWSRLDVQVTVVDGASGTQRVVAVVTMNGSA